MNNNFSTEREPQYFDIASSLFVAVYLIAQVTSSKLFALGPFQFPGAIVIFPISYIFGDILTEVYGYARMRRTIWIGFFAAVVLSLVLLIVQYLPPAPSWPHQKAYEEILGLVPRLVVASIVAYWMGEFANSYVMSKMKLLTKGRHLWARTMGSTIIGQGVDSLVFATGGFVGVVPLEVVFRIVGSIYLFKVLYEAVATPVTYVIVGFLKRAEGLDAYDYKTDFSPFRF